MTSERPRFPLGLTVAVLVVFTLCCGFGVWQLQRAAWKAAQLKHIAAMQAAPPRPIEALLAADAHGQSAAFAPVMASCAPGSAAAPYRLTTDNSDWIARAQAVCRVASGPYDGVLVDRGFLTASRGATTTPTTPLPAPGEVAGVLIPNIRGTAAPGLARPAPYVLVATRETPAPPGVKPAPYPDAADNLHYVGAYAPTWFGLAGALAAIYAAMLWRRYQPKR